MSKINLTETRFLFLPNCSRFRV